MRPAVLTVALFCMCPALACEDNPDLQSDLRAAIRYSLHCEGLVLSKLRLLEVMGAAGLSHNPVFATPDEIVRAIAEQTVTDQKPDETECVLGFHRYGRPGSVIRDLLLKQPGETAE